MENGETAGFWDIIQWWITAYPDDIFITEPEEVVAIRNLMYRLKARGTSDPYKEG